MVKRLEEVSGIGLFEFLACNKLPYQEFTIEPRTQRSEGQLRGRQSHHQGRDGIFIFSARAVTTSVHTQDRRYSSAATEACGHESLRA